ncbi:MAG: NADH:ubiquinone reductase (Na(+)-transporting) subunit C [Candidatus Omnitrophica bacterium]|nr:NADH:ubiquinone reductase (Na(+)-transporting) subunit C [Candidatus Omnitrophota bacterium]
MLSSFYEGLRPRIEMNADVEVKRNILKAVCLKEPLPGNLSNQEYISIYRNKIEELVIDAQGNVVAGKKPLDIKDGMTGLYPLYIYKDNGRIISYAYPIYGFGLWSTMYGYLAIEPDAITVRGITFYKEGETPGLGAEIEKDWFQNNFKGKKIWSLKERKVMPIALVKGKVKDFFEGEMAEHYVDGITAATLTGKGVTSLLDKWIKTYEPFFSKLRKI